MQCHEAPSTQSLRLLVLKTIPLMVFGTRSLTYWVLGPFGATRVLVQGLFEKAYSHPGVDRIRSLKELHYIPYITHILQDGCIPWTPGASATSTTGMKS